MITKDYVVEHKAGWLVPGQRRLRDLMFPSPLKGIEIPGKDWRSADSSGFPGILRTGEQALSFIPYRPGGGEGEESKEAETSDEYKREVGEEAGFSFSFLLSFSFPLLPSPSFPLHPSTILGRNQRS